MWSFYVIGSQFIDLVVEMCQASAFNTWFLQLRVKTLKVLVCQWMYTYMIFSCHVSFKKRGSGELELLVEPFAYLKNKRNETGNVKISWIVKRKKCFNSIFFTWNRLLKATVFDPYVPFLAHQAEVCVSYCHHLSSIVIVVRLHQQFFKTLLHWNYLTNCNQTWYKCSLRYPA